jgi:hypothetical protein
MKIKIRFMEISALRIGARLSNKYNGARPDEMKNTGQTHPNFEVGTPRRGVCGRPGGRTEWDAPLTDAGQPLPVNSNI